MNESSKIKGYNGIFASRFRDLLKERNYTQKYVAEKTHSKGQTISQYVNGEVLPNAEKLYEIAKCFEVSSDYLLGISDVTSSDVDIKAIATHLGLSENTIEHLNDLNYREGAFIPTSDEDKFDAYCADEFLELYNFILEDYNCYDFFLGVIRYCNVSLELYQGQKLKDKLKNVMQDPFKNPELRNFFDGITFTDEGEISFSVTPEEAKFALLGKVADDFKKFVEKYAEHKIEIFRSELRKINFDSAKPKKDDEE